MTSCYATFEHSEDAFFLDYIFTINVDLQYCEMDKVLDLGKNGWHQEKIGSLRGDIVRWNSVAAHVLSRANHIIERLDRQRKAIRP